MTDFICASRGPRIGDDGQPICKRIMDHNGLHRPGPDDGWDKGLMWGPPVSPDLRVRNEYYEAGFGPVAERTGMTDDEADQQVRWWEE